MVYGYIRVSTDRQSDNNSFPVQEQEIKDKYPDAVIYSEAYTATKGVRSVFQEVIEQLKPSDTIVVAKMDRFARSVRSGVDVINDLLNKGVTIDILNLGKLDNSGMGKLLYTMLLAFAEFEANQIAERCKLGRLKARENPEYREGRPPKFTTAQISHALKLLEDGISYRRTSALTGISVSTLSRAKRCAKAMTSENQE